MAGPLFVSSIGDITSPGVQAVEVKAPTIIQGVSNGKILYAGQFGWGPTGEVYEPLSTPDLLSTYEPAGSPRSSTGYLALSRCRGLAIAIYRVLGAGASASSGSVAKNTEAHTAGWTATARYKGVLGNSVQVTVSPASDGDATHKTFTATLTDAFTGTTSEVIADNVALPPSATDVVVDVSGSLLVGTLTLQGEAAGATTGWADDSTVTLSGGANGSAVIAGDYSAAMDALDLVDDGAVLVTDDVGDSIRAAVNAAIKTHAIAAAGRYIGITQGTSGLAWSAVKSDVANYRSKWCNYEAGWLDVYDATGAIRSVPCGVFKASAMVGLEPQQSPAWWASTATDFYAGVIGISKQSWSANDPAVAKDATDLGISIPLRLPDGRIAFLHDRNTDLVISERYTTTSRIRRHIGLSLTAGLTEYVNGPQTLEENNDLLKAVKTLLDDEVRLGRIARDPATGAPLYSLDGKTQNTPDRIAQGYFLVAISAQTTVPREKIGLLMQLAPTVQIVNQ